MIHHTTGNILEANAQALVNPVNCVGVMGKGLALQFKRAYPSYYRCYRDACAKGLVQTGEMYVYLHDRPPYPIIISFPTKSHWQEESKYTYIVEGLVALAQVIASSGIKSIAMPALGCGNGGLKWDTVKLLMQSHLGHLTDTKIFIYEPQE